MINFKTVVHYETLKTLLRQDGCSLTRPRKQVFDLMLNKEPQSMQVLAKRAEGKVDRATVYRTVELFERLGIARRLNIGWKYKIELSDLFTGHHHHFYCTNCGKMYDLPENPMLETMIDSAVAKDGFSARGHQLEVYGLCVNCQPTSSN
ncbi:MAG TPA: Fur family transcriptional regulator [Candidatus Saccharimonadales bacterium]|nr:Fur family transcriptional regulator [Candidatus Saccharimonadales bacterium]